MPPARFCEFPLDAVEHRGRNLVTLYRRVAPWSWRPDRLGRSGGNVRFGLGGWGPITQQRKPDPVTELEKQMKAAAKRLEFEEEAALRDRIKELRAQRIYKT
jgi:hypothetical protein